MDGMQAQIWNAFDAMDNDAEMFQKWATTNISPKDAELMLQRTVAKLPNKSNGDPHFSEPLVRKILDRFIQVERGGTVWALYNAVTWWQTHADFKTNSNVLTSRLSREGRVAGMLRSNPWKEFVDD